MAAGHLHAAGGPQGRRAVHGLHHHRQRRRGEPAGLYARAACSSRPRCGRSAERYVDDAARRDAERRPRGAQPVGRQPAEGAARQMAGARAAHPHRRRADARRRRRLEGRHLPHPARPRRRAAWRSWSSPPTCRRCSRSRIASSSCRTAGSPASSTPPTATEIAILELAAPPPTDALQHETA